MHIQFIQASKKVEHLPTSPQEHKRESLKSKQTRQATERRSTGIVATAMKRGQHMAMHQGRGALERKAHQSYKATHQSHTT